MSGGEDIEPPLDPERHPISLSTDERARLARAIVKELFSQGGDYIALKVGWSIMKRAMFILGVAALAASWWLTHGAQK